MDIYTLIKTFLFFSRTTSKEKQVLIFQYLENYLNL